MAARSGRRVVGVERDRHRCGHDEVAHVHLVAHVERGDVERDRGRHVGGQRLDRDREHHLLEQPAVLHAFGFALEVQRALRRRPSRRHGCARSRRGRACPSPGCAGSAGRAPAAWSPSSWSVITVFAPLPLLRMCCSSRAGTRHRHRVGAEAVHDRGHEALAPEAPGGPRPGVGTRLRGQGCIGHGELEPSCGECERAAGRSRARREPGEVTGSDVVAVEQLADRALFEDRVDGLGHQGAIDSTRRLSNRFSDGIGTVLVTTTSRIGAFFSRSTAGPESRPWVAAT